MGANGWNGSTPMGGRATDIEVGQNQNGNLEIFYTGEFSDWSKLNPSDSNGPREVGSLYRNRQTSSGWTGETAFKGDKAQRMCVGQGQNGTLHIFYAGGNGAVYRNEQSSVNSDTWVGETVLRAPDSDNAYNRFAPVLNGSGQLQVFFLHGDSYGVLELAMQAAPNSGSWSVGSPNIPGYGTNAGNEFNFGEIAAILNKNNLVELFWTEYNGGKLWCCTQSQLGAPAGFNSPIELGGDSAKHIAVARNANGLLELFYIGGNNDLYHKRQLSVSPEQWSAETGFSGTKAQQIVVARNTNGILEVFYRGMGNDLYHDWQLQPNGTAWNGATKFSGEKATSVAVGRNSDGRLEIFFAGDGADNIYHDWQVVAPGGGPYNDPGILP